MNHQKTSPVFTHGIRPFLAAAAAAFVLAGCPNPAKPDNPSNPTKTTPGLTPRAREILQDVRSRPLKSLIVEADRAARAVIDSPSSSPPEKANILLYITGGPVYDTAPLTLEAVSVQIAKNSKYARVILKQEQMIRRTGKTLPTDRVITAEEAEEINLYSAAVIYAVGERFQRMGHKVSIFSHSFGSFVVPKMLLFYGDTPFKKILIAAGRLDMPKALVQNFSAGKFASFDLDTNNIASKLDLGTINRRQDTDSQIAESERKFAASGGFCGAESRKQNRWAAEICIGDKVDENKKTQFINAEWSIFRLQADAAEPRYTTRLQNKLSKVIYYFGGQDINVGSLTAEEINALAGKSTGSGSITSLKVDGSRPVTRNITLKGETVARDITRTVHTINHVSGRPAVRYSLEDDHNLPILFEDTQNDIIASFNS